MRGITRLGDRRGQSVVEYLVVVAVVIAAIIGIRGAFKGSIDQIGSDSNDKVQNSANAWQSTTPEGL